MEKKYFIPFKTLQCLNEKSETEFWMKHHFPNRSYSVEFGRKARKSFITGPVRLLIFWSKDWSPRYWFYWNIKNQRCKELITQIYRTAGWFHEHTKMHAHITEGVLSSITPSNNWLKQISKNVIGLKKNVIGIKKNVIGINKC